MSWPPSREMKNKPLQSNEWLVEIMGVTPGPKHLRPKLAHESPVSLFPAAVTWKPVPDGGTIR